MAYPAFVSPAGLHGMQAVHEAGHALLQCVQRMLLRVVPTEAVSQAAQGIPHQLQFLGLCTQTGARQDIDGTGIPVQYITQPPH